jgi:O-antigen ligase
VITAAATDFRPAGWRAATVAPALALVYFVLLGGTPIGEELGWLRVVNSVLAAVVLVIYLREAPRRADAIDRRILMAVVLFAVASVVSTFPRQSLDAILSVAAYAALLFVAREALTDPVTKSVLVFAMRLLAAGVTAVAAYRIVPPALEWWQLTGGDLPPLGLPMIARPWGHAYDMTLLAVMLYPSWLIGARSRIQATGAVGVGVALSVVVLLVGGRALWLAIVGASVGIIALMAISTRRRHRSSGELLMIGGILVVAAGALVLFGGSILERLATVATVGQRIEMWTATIAAWLERPLTGYGPGSFPWVLQATEYFDSNSLHPRHPDNALFQLLPEAGLLGIAAAGVVLWAVVPGIVRSRAWSSLWATGIFLLAGIGSNPTDFSYLIVVAIIWVAIALPRAASQSAQASVRSGLAALRWGAAALVAVAVGLTLVAGLAYDTAVSRIHSGDVAAGREGLSTAAALDPGMALYVRHRGAAALTLGDRQAAIQDLRRATHLNPTDDVAWRLLALAHREHGDGEAGYRALDQAIDLQRSDPSNLALLAQWQATDGAIDAARQTVAEAVLAWPTLVVAPGWTDMVSGFIEPAAAVDSAIARWERGGSSPEPQRRQLLWLTAVAGRSDLLASASDLSDDSEALDRTAYAVYSCEADAAERLASLTGQDLWSGTYWALRIEQAAQIGDSDPIATRLFEIVTAVQPTAPPEETRLNPMRENNARGSVDSWGYDRIVIRWNDPPVELPSAEAGEQRWMVDPVSAREALRPAGFVPCETSRAASAGRHTP